MSEKASKGRFCKSPRSSKITVTREKERRKRRARRRKVGEEKKTLEGKKVHLAVTLSKLQLENSAK